MLRVPGEQPAIVNELPSWKKTAFSPAALSWVIQGDPLLFVHGVHSGFGTVDLHSMAKNDEIIENITTGQQ